MTQGQFSARLPRLAVDAASRDAMPGGGSSPPRSAARSAGSRTALLLLGVWMALCGGTLYAFSAWEVELMAQCRLSASQLGMIYTCGQCGVGLGLVPGLIYDRRGPRGACLYALVMTLAGNAGLHLALSGSGHGSGCASPPILGALYALLQNGSVAMYQSGLLSNQTAAPRRWQGTVVGVVAAGYGLSAAAFSQAYTIVFQRDLREYLRGTGAIFAVTSIVGALALPRLMATDGASAGYGRVGEATASSPGSVSPQAIGAPTEVEASESGTPSKEVVVEKELDISLREAVRSCDLWHSIGMFSLLQAVGSGMFIANLSLMSDSLGVPTHQRMVYVRTVSYCNCFGRILAGVALDSAEARCGVPRPAHYLWTSGVLVCAAALLRTVPDDGMREALFLALMAVGLAYGANWAIMPSCLIARFGSANKGVLFNMHASGLAVAVALVSSAVGGLYDAVAVAQGGARGFCVGPPCWRGSYGIGLAMSVVGFVSAIALVLRARAAQT